MHESEKKKMKDTCASKVIPINLYTQLLCTTKIVSLSFIIMHEFSKKVIKDEK